MSLSHKPRLSIGLPVYNGGRFLAQAIESLLAQTFTDFRLIISDNASTDSTAEICHSYRSRDSRIVYRRATENHGPVWNINHVVHLADSEYFKWAAHDDLCAPQLVERCIDVLDHQPRVVLCYTKSDIIDEDGKVVSAYDNRVNATAPTPCARFCNVLSNLSLGHMMFGVIRLDVLRRTQLHCPYATGDLTLVAELALHGEFREVDETLFMRRHHVWQPHRAHRTRAELAAWYNPGNTRSARFPRWAQLADHVRAIARAPIGLAQKLGCVSFAMVRLPIRWRRERARLV